MKKVLSCIILTFVCVGTSTIAQDSSVNWVKVAENNYINPDGIVGTENFYGFTFLLKAYNKGQYEPIFDKRVSYTLSQYTINCGDYTYKIGLMDSYGEKDNFIYGDYNRYAQFQPIVSGTAVGEVAKRVCRPILH